MHNLCKMIFGVFILGASHSQPASAETSWIAAAVGQQEGIGTITRLAEGPTKEKAEKWVLSDCNTAPVYKGQTVPCHLHSSQQSGCLHTVTAKHSGRIGEAVAYGFGPTLEAAQKDCRTRDAKCKIGGTFHVCAREFTP